MSASAARRPPVATPVLGAALLVAAAAAFSLGGFHLSRAPGECGGGGSAPCPDGFALGLAGFCVAIFGLAPLGTLLLNRTLKRATAIAVALSVGGASAGVYAGGFVAEPVSDGSVGYVVAASVTGLVALVAVLLVVRPFPGPAAIARRERVRAELLRRVTVEQEQAREAAGARASG